jgi:hypothetical protein
MVMSLPHADLSLEVATNQGVPIRAPGQREDGTRMWDLLQECTVLGIPDVDDGIVPATGE